MANYHKTKNGKKIEEGTKVLIPATVTNIRNSDPEHKGAGIVVQLNEATPNGDRPSIAVHGNQLHIDDNVNTGAVSTGDVPPADFMESEEQKRKDAIAKGGMTSPGGDAPPADEDEDEDGI